MLGAGKDCTALFDKFHAWVNIDSMLSKCYVGTLIPDDSKVKEDVAVKHDSSTKVSDDDSLVEDVTNRIAVKTLLSDETEDSPGTL